MTTELWVLLASAILMLVMPTIYGPGFIKAVGSDKMLGNRDNMPAIEGWFARGKRAHANLGENLIPFAAVVLVAHAAGVHTGWTRAAAIVFLLARLAHGASYFGGIGRPRAVAYVAGLVATLVLAVAVVVNAG